MNNNRNISKLALLTIDKKGGINEKAANYALKNLSRKDLARYMISLKRIISANFVTIYHEGVLSQEIKTQLSQKFGNNIIFNKTDKIRDGIKVSHNDTIIDLSVNGYIKNTFDKLEN